LVNKRHSNIGIDLTYSDMKKAYSSLIAYKHWYKKQFAPEFSNHFNMEIKCFVRELFLDPAECENASYLLPQLGRDSFEKKGQFYRLDKILIDMHLSQF
jgi:hypothetical protein